MAEKRVSAADKKKAAKARAYFEQTEKEMDALYKKKGIRTRGEFFARTAKVNPTKK